VSYLERAAAGDPGEDLMAEVHFQLGKARMDQNRLAEAERSLLRALELNPSRQTHMSVHYQLGSLYRRLGSLEEAKKHQEAFRKLQQEILGGNKKR
jgi:tetratricopeptide (TPR) repeat protein